MSVMCYRCEQPVTYETDRCPRCGLPLQEKLIRQRRERLKVATRLMPSFLAKNEHHQWGNKEQLSARQALSAADDLLAELDKVEPVKGVES